MIELPAVFNLAEACLWFAIAAVVLVRGGRSYPLLALAFLAFGASDLVEMRSGAWWRPWWLFVWKAACVGVFGWFAWRHRGKLPRD